MITEALRQLKGCNRESTSNGLLRSAAITHFDLAIESAGKALRRALKEYFGSARTVDALTFNESLRHAAEYQIMDAEAVERWLTYRKNRNNTAHDYNEQFAEETLQLLPAFVQDLRSLATALQDR